MGYELRLAGLGLAGARSGEPAGLGATESAVPADMFPQTPHLEVLAVLTRP